MLLEKTSLILSCVHPPKLDLGKSLKLLTAIICLSLCCVFEALGQAKIHGLPAGALVVETRSLPSRLHANRSLVLWMQNPKKVPSDYGSDDVIPCPFQTRGSYYSGLTRVSLVNSTANRIINTVKIQESSSPDNDQADGEGTFDVPYAIRKGYYYHVAAPVRRTVEAKPTIMLLRDYNGDGKALEFALFDAHACMGLQTTLIGYSEKRDRVIQYPISLDVMEGSKKEHRNAFWADYLFNIKPRRRGYWRFEIDYTGRGGTLDKWEVRYNAAQERFEGKLMVKREE